MNKWSIIEDTCDGYGKYNIWINLGMKGGLDWQANEK